MSVQITSERLSVLGMRCGSQSGWSPASRARWRRRLAAVPRPQRCAIAHAHVGASPDPISGSGRVMNCACPPGRCTAATIRRDTSTAAAAPKSR